MRFERLQWTLAVITYCIIIGMILYSTKPLCTDSPNVEKLDRVSSEKIETLYRCSARIKVAYSPYFEVEQTALERRIDAIVLFLSQLEPMKSRMQITIDDTKPIVFKVAANRIHIGSQLVKANGHLERAIIKIWLSERHSKRIDTTLFTEVAADFVYYLYSGSIKIEDPLRNTHTTIGFDRWPQVLKSTDGYCESPWKLSEHFWNCELVRADNILTDHNIINLSIRPLMTGVWIKAYNELSFRDRLSLRESFVEFLDSQDISSQKAIQMVMAESHPLKQGIQNIKKITDTMNSSPLVQDRKEFREFYSRTAIHLQQSGVSDSFAEAYFDFMFEYPDDLSADSLFFKSLAELSRKYPQYQMAVRDQTQIWILPTKASLPLKTFDQIKNQQHVYFACPGLKEVPIGQFLAQSEKLLLIKGCDQSKVLNFEQLVQNGIRAFSGTNKNLAFIQFHLPSFEMKAKELAHVKNFFELVKNRDMNRAEFQTLGWSQIQWFEDVHAYKPNAIIDAIELFRTDIN